MLLIPAKCDPISVCVEDDNDLRVDCLIQSKPNKINTYEFSWSSGTKMSVIYTNVSGSAAESQFKGKSYVEELEPYGYRLTLNGFTDKLPHNTTYMCRITGDDAKVNVEKGRRIDCVCGFGGGSIKVSEWESNLWGFCQLFTSHLSFSAEQLVPCSAVSVFLKSSCSWIVCVLLFFYDLHS